jgi:hypothetical protein
VKPRSIHISDDVILSARILELIGKGREWGAELWGKLNQDNFVISDLLLLKQNASFAQFDCTNENRAESLYYHRQKIQEMECVGWIHSHAKMTPFLSSTDHKQIEEIYLNELDTVISVVVSSNKTSKLMNNQSDFDFKCWVTYVLDEKIKHKIISKDKIMLSENIFIRKLPPGLIYQLIVDFNKLVTHKQFNISTKKKRKIDKLDPYQVSIDLYW